MTDLETRLRALADAGSSAATQPTTDELLAKPQPVQRKWLPVTLIAAATAAIVTLAVVRPWATGDQAAVQSSCAGKTAILSVKARDAGSVGAARREVVARIRAVTGSTPCITRSGDVDTLSVDLADSAALLPDLLGPASLVRVSDEMPCTQAPDAPAGQHWRATLDVGNCLLIGDPVLQLDGLVAKSGGARAEDGSYSLYVVLKDTAAPALAELADPAHSRLETVRQFAVTFGGRVFGPVTVPAGRPAHPYPLTLAGGLTAAELSMVTHLADRSQLPEGTVLNAISASADPACAAKPIAYVVKETVGEPLDMLAARVRTRVEALTADGCVETTPEYTINIRLDPSQRASVTPALLRGDLWIAPVKEVCGSVCASAAVAHMYPNLNGSSSYVVDEGRKVDVSLQLLRGRLVGNSSGYVIHVYLQGAAATALDKLTSQVVGANAPGNQLAIVSAGVVIAAPVVTHPIVDGDFQFPVTLTDEQARYMGGRLSAPGLGNEVSIESAARANP